ncbi:glycoside hydrolase family 16 protein [Flavobacterium granuli]|uniref:Beta-glucanase (GH16 family) n=1 Tax=Flavobacterium granuli TaxID=280093 RepID=A0A1M5M0X8_9FLAO|nr:glycoside hydrolase family 16 protein [Flavobacterium granuli]PRZ24178.1 beta-glucanase (GH16 family) [Flavobacterium granuli]SHG71002.1 Beta-glucanase, GH16 family [Flavobacterium granuli]
MNRRNEKKALTTRLFFVLMLISAASLNAQKKEKWKLVWREEFNYTGLPDSAKWGYEVGHIRNNEQQYYTKARKENVWVSKGVLAITGRKESYPNESFKKESKDWKTKDSLAQYTSASINTLGKVGWKYGRIEVKAKLPRGGGIWPAIWMMGTNRPEVGWPKCGEIDVMEFIGNHPKDIYGTIHYPDPVSNGNKSNGGKIVAENLDSQFHIYAIEWNEQTIDIYFDDNKYHSFSIDTAGQGADNPFRKPFYLLLNLAMGANWPGPIDDTVLPQQFLVDYVRVYQKK